MNKNILIVLILLFNTFNIYAEYTPTKDIDSALNGINNYQESKSDNLLLYTNLPLENNFSSVNKEAYYRQIETKISYATNYKKSIAKYFKLLAYSYLVNSQYDLAFDCFYKAFQMNADLNDKIEISRNLANIALVYHNQNESIKEANISLSALKIIEDISDKKFIENNAISIGKIYESLGRTIEASEYYNKAFKKSIVNNSSIESAEALYFLGNINLKELKLKSAVSYFNKSLKLCEHLNNKSLILYLELGLTDAYRSLIEENIKSLSDRQLNSRFADEKFKIEFNKHSKIAISLGQELCDYKALSDIYGIISSFNIWINNPKLAFSNGKISFNYRDSAITQESKLKIISLEAKREQDIKNKEIEILLSEKFYQSAKVDYLGAIIILVIMTAIIILLFLIKKRNDNLFLQIQNKNLNDARENLENAYYSLESKEKELIKVSVTKDKFFTIISQDLKSPITNFHYLIENLINNFYTQTDEVKLKNLNVLQKSSLKVINLLETLLTWSRVQSNKVKIYAEDFDLNELILQEIANAQEESDSKHINIVYENNKESYVSADRGMIATSISNLLSNAIKYSYVGGEITIRIVERDDEYETQIIDNGIGISDEDKEKIFSPDYNHLTLGSLGEKGSGISLKLTKEYIEMNQGELNFLSNNDRETTFFFTTPKIDVD